MLRDFTDPAVGQAMEREVIAAIRDNPPDLNPGRRSLQPA